VDRWQRIKLEDELKKLKKKRKRKKDYISVLFDLKNQEFFIPITHVERNPRLASYLTMQFLGKLQVSTSMRWKVLGNE